jgi:hypothetical protein
MVVRAGPAARNTGQSPMAAESAHGADEAEELRQTVFSAGPVFVGSAGSCRGTGPGPLPTTHDAILAAAGRQLGGRTVTLKDGVAR